MRALSPQQSTLAIFYQQRRWGLHGQPFTIGKDGENADELKDLVLNETK